MQKTPTPSPHAERYTESITVPQYSLFQTAYDFFNKTLFGSTLPHVLVTLQRHARMAGYFAPERFNGRIVQTVAHELAMNPDIFTGNTDEEILSTLAHEMVHVWRETQDRPPRRCYHDKKWAAQMKQIGLQPSHTGKPGGRETGQSMTHYIIPNGPYAKAYTKLKASGFQLQWQSKRHAQAKTKAASKTKFTCPQCQQNAWAKPDAQLECAVCSQPMGSGQVIQVKG